MKKRRNDSDFVEADAKSKTLGLEDYLPERKNPVLATEHHRAGEKCEHWLRLPNGKIGHMDPRAVKLAPCRFCMGGGILLGNITLTRTERMGWIPSADDLKSMEEARRGFIPRRVA